MWHTAGMKAYSLDLRHKLLDAVDRGIPRTEVAATFGVSLATVRRYLRRRQATGTVAASSIPGRPARLGDALDAGLVAQLAAHPDATVAEHCRIWQETTGQVVSEPTMRRAIHRLGWTFKKRP